MNLTLLLLIGSVTFGQKLPWCAGNADGGLTGPCRPVSEIIAPCKDCKWNIGSVSLSAAPDRSTIQLPGSGEDWIQGGKYAEWTPVLAWFTKALADNTAANDAQAKEIARLTEIVRDVNRLGITNAERDKDALHAGPGCCCGHHAHP